MQEISTQVQWDQFIPNQPAALVLFGGKKCGVCQALKPRIEAIFQEQYPKIALAYIDCQSSGLKLCASRSVFSLPVIQLWFEGQFFSEFVRNFSLAQLTQAAERPYQFL
jgi:thioredoxin-like negative regulator of GroEL